MTVLPGNHMRQWGPGTESICPSQNTATYDLYDA